MRKYIFFILVFIFGLAAALFLLILAGSAQVDSFEECERAGWLIRERIVYSLAKESLGQLEKECILWTGRRFAKMTD